MAKKKDKVKDKIKETNDLSFLFTLFPRKGTIWNPKNMKKLVMMLKKGHKIPYIVKRLSVKESSIKIIIQELKKASMAGFDIDEYVKSDRPCMYGKKVLAK